jgi:hypothetical protein
MYPHETISLNIQRVKKERKSEERKNNFYFFFLTMPRRGKMSEHEKVSIQPEKSFCVNIKLILQRDVQKIHSKPCERKGKCL